MNKDLIIAILALAFAGAAAALLVTLAKLQEEKDRRWDEISRAAGLEEELRRMHLLDETRRKQIIENDQKYFGYVSNLQDRLSALLCPRNDHIWEDGICKRCGRLQWKS